MSDSEQPVANGDVEERSPKRRRLSAQDSSDNEPFVDFPPPDDEPPAEPPLPPNPYRDDDMDDSYLRVGTAAPRPAHLSSPGSGVRSPAGGAPPTPQESDYYTDQASSPVPAPAHDPDADRAATPAPQQLHYKPSLILRGHKRAVAGVKFSPNGHLIASCSADATAKIWDAATGKPLHTLTGHLAGISALAWTPDSATLATGSDDKAIRLWSAQTGRPHARPLLGHHNYIYSLAFSPKGNVLASGSYDEAVFLWDVRTRALLRALPAHGDPVSGVDFSHDGTLVASCASDGLVRVWDAASGQCLRTFFHEDTPAVAAVKFSPNSRYVATWMLDGSVRLWDYFAQRARCVKTLQGHANARFSVAGSFGAYVPPRRRVVSTSPRDDGDDDDEMRDVDGDGDGDDGADDDDDDEGSRPRAFLVSGSEDGAIVVWDVVSKAVLQRIPGAHAGVVFGVDAHPARRALVSCGQDRTVRLWRDGGGGDEHDESRAVPAS